MADQRISELLRIRREQVGMSISQAAQQTNIRPRVLETFEAGDYKNFPPRGYATGMLSSYARCLGLDPRIVLTGYEEELAAFEHRMDVAHEAETRVAGGKTSRFGRVRSRSAKNAPEPSQTGAFDPMMTGEIDTGGDIARATSAVKVVERQPGNSRSRRSRGAHSASRSAGRRVASSASASSQGGSRLDAYRDSMRTRYSSDNKPFDTNSEAAVTGRLSSATGSFSTVKSSSSITPNTGRISAFAQTGNLPDSVKEEIEAEFDDYTVRGGKRYNPHSRTSSGSRSRSRDAAPDVGPIARIKGAIGSVLGDSHSRLIAVAIALAVIAVIVAASMLLHSAGDENAGILDVVGGGEGQSSTDLHDDGNGTATATITTANGNPVVISVSVAEGSTSLIDITYDDDNAYSGTAVGPWSREFQVTETMTAVFGTPEAVTVLENGAEIEIPQGDDGTGKLTVNVQAEGLATG